MRVPLHAVRQVPGFLSVKPVPVMVYHAERLEGGIVNSPRLFPDAPILHGILWYPLRLPVTIGAVHMTTRVMTP